MQRTDIEVARTGRDTGRDTDVEQGTACETAFGQTTTQGFGRVAVSYTTASEATLASDMYSCFRIDLEKNRGCVLHTTHPYQLQPITSAGFE